MQAYRQLLAQFHSEQASIIEDDCHVEYIKILNQLKQRKQKNSQKIKKHRYNQSRIKTINEQTMKTSQLQKSFYIQKKSQLQQNYKQKRSMIQLQRLSLVKQIQQINNGYEKLKIDKQIVEQEIRMIGKKQIQIKNALYESNNNLQELRYLIRQHKQENDKEFILFDRKINELVQKFKQVNQENMLKSKQYDYVKNKKKQHQNNQIIGNILHWQNQQSKIKTLPKKLYTKQQTQSMLRTLYLLIQFSQLNYANIIEHLIQISDNKQKINNPDNQQNINSINKTKSLKQIKQNKKIYINQKGQQIEIKQLIKKLELELLTSNQCKFLSKAKIFQFYTKKGVIIQSHNRNNKITNTNKLFNFLNSFNKTNPNFNNTNNLLNNKTQSNNSNQSNSPLSKQTNNIIKKIVQHYEKLTSWFSRIQKRNIQLSQYFRSLQKIQQNLQTQIKQIQNSFQQKSKTYLQQRQQEILHYHQKLNQSCKIIFLFNINIYDLIKRFTNLNKFFDQIIKSTKRKTFKKTFVQIQENNRFLQDIHKILFKSPQCIILNWNNVIKRHKTQSSLINKSQLPILKAQSSKLQVSSKPLSLSKSSLIKKQSLQKSQSLPLNNPSLMAQSQQLYQKIPQNQIYFETIMKNDLLRIYAEPQMYDQNKSYIQNLSNTFQYVIRQQNNIIQRLFNILEDLLLFSKNGIIQFQIMSSKKITTHKHITTNKNIKTQKNILINISPSFDSSKQQINQISLMTQFKEFSQQPNPINQLNSLPKLINKSQLKIDKFLNKDQIKQDPTTTPILQQQGFCVESNDFYRRDNYKLIEKLQKINLKKRGLLAAVPFMVNTSLELQPITKTHIDNISFDNDMSRFGSTRNSYRKREPRLSHQLLSTRHNKISERRQNQSQRKKDLKMLLKNISNIATENQKYRIRKKLNNQQQSFSMSSSKIWTNRSRYD